MVPSLVSGVSVASRAIPPRDTGHAPFCVEPLTRLLYGALSESCRDSKRKVSSMAILAVAMWRAIIILMLSAPEIMAVPLEAFVRDPESAGDYSFVTDAADWAGLVM